MVFDELIDNIAIILLLCVVKGREVVERVSIHEEKFMLDHTEELGSNDIEATLKYLREMSLATLVALGLCSCRPEDQEIRMLAFDFGRVQSLYIVLDQAVADHLSTSIKLFFCTSEAYIGFVFYSLEIF